MTQLWPSLISVAQVVEPETILHWHPRVSGRSGAGSHENRAGRPKVERSLRDLIHQMSQENPTWGAPRIHGELLMLRFEVAQFTVSKDMLRGRGPRSQRWKTFLRNQARRH